MLAGVVGFLPFMIALRASRQSYDSSMLRVALFGLGGFFVSLFVLALALFACSRLAHDALLPFGLTAILSLIIVTSVYVARKNGLGKKGDLT